MKDLLRFLSRWQNLLALAIVLIYIGIALAAPLLAPEKTKEQTKELDKTTQRARNTPHPPSKVAPLGTVATGILDQQIDVYSNVIWGTRSALEFGLIVALSTAIIGSLIGATSAYFGGAINNITMRITDAFLTFPIIVGVVLFEQLLGIATRQYGLLGFAISEAAQQSPNLVAEFLNRVNPVMVALILFSWMPYARVINAVVMRAKGLDYIQASRALGASHLRIILNHLLPNTMSPAIVMAARDIGGMVILQATLTFIGLGGGSTWGSLLATGRRWIIGPGGNPLTYWWVFVPGTLALILFGIGWNLLGDGLNEWLNPRTANHLEM